MEKFVIILNGVKVPLAGNSFTRVEAGDII